MLSMNPDADNMRTPHTETGTAPRASFQWSGVDIGAYRIGREIARGGMGIVYEARHAQLERMVALKLMRGGAFGEPARFRAETEAVARLDHPNIVPIYEVGEFGDQPYFTMKRIDGGSLADRLRDGPLPEREIARLMVKVCRAVHHAHERGVLHRDLKPANILLDPPKQGEILGEPHLTDFGLAKFAGVESGFTNPGEVIGTPEYISPEQISTNPGELTTASDVWALGVLLYQMLSGRMPFTASTPLMILEAIKNSEPPALQCDHDLATLVARCLEKDPSRRMRSAAYLAEELERWLKGEPIRSRHVTPAEKLIKFVRRNPWRVAAAALLLVSILTGSIVSFVLWQDASRANEKLSESLLKSTSARLATESRVQSTTDPQLGLLLAVESAETVRRTGAEILPESVDALYSALQLTGGVDTSAPRERINTHFVSVAYPSPDGKLLITISHLSDGVHAALFDCRDTGGSTPVIRWKLQDSSAVPVQWRAQWMPDSRSIVVTDLKDRNFRARIWRLPNFASGSFEDLPLLEREILAPMPRDLNMPDSRIVTRSDGMPIGAIAISGTTGDFASYFQPLALGAASQEPGSLVTVQGGADILRRIAPAKNGDWIALYDPYSDGAPALVRALPRDQEFAHFLPNARSPVIAACVSNNARWCAFGTSKGPVELYNLSSDDFDTIEKSRIRFENRRTAASTLAISPDEKWMLVGGESSIAELYNLEGTPELRRRIRVQSTSITCCAFSEDSQWFAIGSSDKVVRTWRTDAQEVDLPAEFRGLPATVNSVSFSPDTRTLHAVSRDGSSRMWNFDGNHAGRLPLSSASSNDGIFDIAVSPDGRWIATATARRFFNDPNEKESTVRFFDTRGGLKEYALPGHRVVTGVAFSQDGKWFASTGRDSLVKVWQLPDLAAALDAGKPLPTPRILEPVWETRDIAERRIAFHPRGSIFATSSDGLLFEWDLHSDSDTGFAWPVHAINYLLPDVRVSPDGKLLYVTRHGGDKLADVVRRSIAIARWALGFPLENERKFLRRNWTQYGNMVLVFDCSKPGRLPELLNIPSPLDFNGGLAISDDGKWIGVGTYGQLPSSIWNTTSFKNMPAPILLPSQGAHVTSVAFSPPSLSGGSTRWFATATMDGRITLHDFQRGDAFTRRINVGAGILSLAFLPDGRLAGGGLDGRLRIWETDENKLIELARQTAGRELSQTELNRFTR